jgi:hypothetical protein
MFFKMKKEKIAKKVLNIKTKEIRTRGSPRSRWEEQIMKYVKQNEGRVWDGIEEEGLREDRDR